MTDEPKDEELIRPDWVESVDKMGFLELIEKYRGRVVHKETGLPFEPTRRKAEAYSIEKLAFETGWPMRVGLKVFTPVCAMFFGISFLWDWYGLIRSCSVAGIIGFSTNWVAIKMLFWPRQNRPVFGQGLIPSQRDQLIEKVADEVLKNLINEQLIMEKIDEIGIVPKFSTAMIEKLEKVVQDDEFKADLQNMVLTYVAELTANPEFRDRLARRAEDSLEEFAGTRFRSWLVRRLKDVWRAPLIQVLNQEIERLDSTVADGVEHLDDIVERLPAVLEARRDSIDKFLSTMLLGLVREVDVRAIVLEQLDTVTPEQLEQGFREFSDDKLSFITLLGGMLGLVGGTVIIWPLPSIAVIASLLLMLTLADLAIYPFMKSRYYPKKKQ